MIRRLLLSALTGLSLLTPLALTPAVEAHGDFGRPRRVYRQSSCYRVLYKECRCDPWRCYGHYDCRCEAERAADSLSARGFIVTIRA